MGLQNEVSLLQGTPTTGHAAPGLNQVKGTFVFRAPQALLYAISAFINLNEAARRQYGMHGVVFAPYIRIAKPASSGLGQISERNQFQLLGYVAGGYSVLLKHVEAQRCA